MRALIGMTAALALLTPGSYAWANQSENCAAKAYLLQLKLVTQALKGHQKICKGLDSGAVAAFDALPAGDNDGEVEEEEMDAADFDFAKLAAQLTKTYAKIVATVDKGGPECSAHNGIPVGSDPPEVDEAMARDLVASVLDSACR